MLKLVQSNLLVEVIISGWVFECFFMVFVGIVAWNGILLYQLTKKGDSKKEFIKTKSMAETLQITVMFLVIDSIAFGFNFNLEAIIT